MKTVFVTLVYDGMPFIKRHPEVFRRLKIPWEWHVVEGVALLRHDTAWSVARGGRVPVWAMQNSLSTDGTTEFLDHMKKRYPNKVFVHRKAGGEFWDGKIEMERAYLPFLREPCLLWEISSDELWAPWQIENVVNLFKKNPARTAAWFWCNFYVGPGAVVSSRHGYSQDPDVEWLRVYRYRPGDEWQSHEPNVLVGRRPPFFRKVNVGTSYPFTQAETEAVGAVFDHYAYATQEQVAFKARYYGYRNLPPRWQKLQRDVRRNRALLLREYFSWVRDETTVSTPRAMGLQPMARLISGRWRFRFPDPPRREGLATARILVDAPVSAAVDRAFGAGAWKKVCQVWAANGFSRRILRLDQTDAFAAWPGVMNVRSSKKVFLRGPWAGFFLGHICRRQQISLFMASPGGPLPWGVRSIRFNIRQIMSNGWWKKFIGGQGRRNGLALTSSVSAVRLAGTLRKILGEELDRSQVKFRSEYQ